MTRRLLPVASWVVALVSCGSWLLGAGGARLAGPDLRRPAGWAAWADARPPADAAFGVVRLLALAAVAYLLLLTVVGLATRLLGLHRLARHTDRLSLGLLRRLLDGAVGVGFTVSALGVAALPAAAQPAPGARGVEVAAGSATLRATGGAPSTATLTARSGPEATAGRADLRAVTEPTGRATMHATPPPTVPDTPLGPAPEPASAAAALDVQPAANADATEDAPDVGGLDQAAAPLDRWTVRPGEHLWSIAEQVVPPGAGEAEVAAYWSRLVTLNRAALADPDCPDLLFVGQVLELPPP